ncbi:MAG: SpoIIE family protein phosphatase [Campylobacterales bacterium]
MKINKFRSISTKLVILLSMSAMIALILSSVVTFTYIIYTKKDENIKSLSQLTNIMGKNLITAIDFRDKEIANSILRTLNTDKDIEASFIFLNSNINNIFASYIKKSLSKTEIINQLKNYYQSNDMKIKSQTMNVDKLIVSTPIYIDNNYVATFCIISNTNNIKEIIQEQFIMQAIVFIIVLLIIIILAFRIQKIFTTPIFQLKDAMENISENYNYDIDIKSKNNDEYKILFDGFKNMLNTIKERDFDLKIAKEEVEKIHKKTKESIEYASLIQHSLIPNKNIFEKYFDDSFTIWHPKDIVGGDIYMMEELNENEVILMLIDCTGHGVPGAFVTMLVKAVERQVISNIQKDEDISPAKILKIFNKNIQYLLRQDDKNTLSNVGFDGGIIYYNKKEKIIKYAGSNTPLYYYQNNQLKMIKGDRQSVGYKKSNINFTYHDFTIDVKDDTYIYITTDGFIDQCGGKKGLPLGKTRFMKIIEKNISKDLVKQQQIFLSELKKYANNNEQNDDVSVIGIKI